MSKRKTTGKRLRFSIFARDQFTCRYCGKQPDEVKLVIDHIIPVAQGGTNDESNLITSCESCNQGKTDKTIQQTVPCEYDRLRSLQETREQIQVAQSLIELTNAKAELREQIVNHYCHLTGHEEISIQTLNVLVSYASEHGVEMLYGWMEAASRSPWACDSDNHFGRYVSGCRRLHLETIAEINEAEEEARTIERLTN